MHHDSLLFERGDGRLDLGILRLDGQGDKDFVDYFIGDDAREILDVAEPGNVTQTVVVKAHLTVDIAYQPVTEVMAMQHLAGEPFGARSRADDQNFLDVVAGHTQAWYVGP